MNWFTAVILTACGASIGLISSMKLKRRAAALKQALLLIDDIQIKIGYQALSLPDIFREAYNVDYDRLKFLGNLSDGPFHKAWEKGVRDCFDFYPEDKTILCSLGKGLGDSDKSGQLALLQSHRALLQRHLEAAEEEYIKKGKMLRSVGILCGLAAGIVVL